MVTTFVKISAVFGPAINQLHNVLNVHNSYDNVNFFLT